MQNKGSYFLCSDNSLDVENSTWIDHIELGCSFFYIINAGIMFYGFQKMLTNLSSKAGIPACLFVGQLSCSVTAGSSKMFKATFSFHKLIPKKHSNDYLIY